MRAAHPLDFADLAGWAADDHAAALVAYGASADLLSDDWPRPAREPALAFFERQFRPVPIGGGTAFLTGYYEPEISGSPTPGAGYHFPLYAPPAELSGNAPWKSRAEIEDGDLLAGTELVWLMDPVEAFFAQVQGSARIRFPDGAILRLGFAARNGHPYRSIGAELIARGEISAEDMSAQAIREWCASHPEEVPDLLRRNPSFVFFRRLDLSAEAGPLGTMGRSVTPMRSIAVDPDFIPLGAPVWVEHSGGAALMVAQDTGSAIKGPSRADIYCGSGDAAGARAGSLREQGRMVPLLPRRIAEGWAA